MPGRLDNILYGPAQQARAKHLGSAAAVPGKGPGTTPTLREVFEESAKIPEVTPELEVDLGVRDPRVRAFKRQREGVKEEPEILEQRLIGEATAVESSEKPGQISRQQA